MGQLTCSYHIAPRWPGVERGVMEGGLMWEKPGCLRSPSTPLRKQ